jgi:hypothetical protein
MLEILSAVFGSSAVGSLIGGLFALMNRKTDLEAKRIDNQLERDRMANALAIRGADLDIAKAEAAGRSDVAMIEGDAQVESARFSAVAAAHEADRLGADEIKAAGWWSWLLVLVESLRRAIRPVATIALTACALTISITLVMQLQAAQLGVEQTIDLGKMAINWVFFQAGGTVSYWFVMRPTRA